MLYNIYYIYFICISLNYRSKVHFLIHIYSIFSNLVTVKYMYIHTCTNVHIDIA